MTNGDKATLQERLDKDQAFIKNQHRIPKAQRDHKHLAKVKDRSDRLKGWLKEK